MNGRLLQRVGLTLALILTLTGLARPAAAQSPGTVRAWGWNFAGQLGNGTTTDSDTPVPVSGLSGVVTVAAGEYHSLAVKSDGTVWAWGSNSNGQLGNGSHTDRSTPVAAFLGDAVGVAGGLGHSLALKSNGTVWAWGSNEYGQLGNNLISTGPGAESTTPVSVSLYGAVTAIAAGYEHSLALMSDGTVWAWGNNQSGQLGNGTNLGRSYPVQVVGLSGVVAIAAGWFHSLALKSNGEVMAWGSNGWGQLGNSTNTDSNTPVAAWLLPRAVGIAGGDLHSVAVKEDGTVWNWGMSYADIGSTGPYSNTPLQVSGVSPIVSLAAGGIFYPFGAISYSMALKSDGTAWQWRLGASPQQVNGLTGAVRIDVGGGHNLAIVNPTVGIYPGSVNLGTINTGSSSASQNVTITNIGPDPLVVSSLSIGGSNPGDFSVTGPALPATVPMYSSLTAAVRFTPAAAGARSGTLVFGDNGFQGPHVVSLSGSGVVPTDVAVSQSVTLTGKRLTYTIIVRNNGPMSAATVTLKDTVPSQTQFVSVAGPGCFPPGTLGFVTCNLLTLSSGMQTTVTLIVDVTATQPAQISNTATVSSTTPDPKTTNNSSTLVTSWTGPK